MAKIVNTYGSEKIERMFNFDRQKGYTEAMKVVVECDAALTAEQTESVVYALDEFVDKVKKIVEKF